MIFKQLTAGMYTSNCYIIGDNGEGAVIDPGVDCKVIMQAADSLSLVIKYIIITHTHFDHIVSLEELKASTGAKVLVHESDAPAVTDALLNGSILFGLNKTFSPPDQLLKDGSEIQVGRLKLEIIHTPGHSPGGICIKAENRLFSGDTLFQGSVGRTDLLNGSMEALLKAIRGKLMKLPDDTIVYPGHGPSTTIGDERRQNPWIQ